MEIANNSNKNMKLALILIGLLIAMVLGIVIVNSRIKLQNRAAENIAACTYKVKVTCKVLKKQTPPNDPAPPFRGTIQIVEDGSTVVSSGHVIQDPITNPNPHIIYLGGTPGKVYQCRAYPDDDMKYCYKDTGTPALTAPVCGPEVPPTNPPPKDPTPTKPVCKDCDALMCAQVIDDSGETNVVDLVIKYKKDSCNPQDFVCKDGSIIIERNGKKITLSKEECEKLLEQDGQYRHRIHQSDTNKCVDYKTTVNGATCQNATCTTNYCCPLGCAKIVEVPPSSGQDGDGCSDKCNFTFINPDENAENACLQLPSNNEVKVKITAGNGGIDFDDDFSTEDGGGPLNTGDTISYQYTDGGFYNVKLTCLDQGTTNYFSCTKRLQVACGGPTPTGGVCPELPKPKISIECKNCTTPTPWPTCPGGVTDTNCPPPPDQPQ